MCCDEKELGLENLKYPISRSYSVAYKFCEGMLLNLSVLQLPIIVEL